MGGNGVGLGVWVGVAVGSGVAVGVGSSVGVGLGDLPRQAASPSPSKDTKITMRVRDSDLYFDIFSPVRLAGILLQALSFILFFLYNSSTTPKV